MEELSQCDLAKSAEINGDLQTGSSPPACALCFCRGLLSNTLAPFFKEEKVVGYIKQEHVCCQDGLSLGWHCQLPPLEGNNCSAGVEG